MKKNILLVVLFGCFLAATACHSNNSKSTTSVTKDSTAKKDTIGSEYNNPAAPGAQNGE